MLQVYEHIEFIVIGLNIMHVSLGDMALCVPVCMSVGVSDCASVFVGMHGCMPACLWVHMAACRCVCGCEWPCVCPCACLWV